MNRARGDSLRGPASGTDRRLFFAAWPSAPVQRQLIELQRCHCDSGARRVRAANLHLTLLFVGACGASLEAELRAAADGIRLPAFELRLERVGGIAGRGLLWSRAVSVPATLIELADALRALASAAGVAVERRVFAPHVTLARRATACRAAQHAPICWWVDGFSLAASTLRPDGARYESVQDWPLR